MKSRFHPLNLMLAAGFVAFFSIGLESQEIGPLTLNGARFEPARARAGERAVLELSVSLEAGWHIYGKKEKTGEPPSLTITNLAALAGILSVAGSLDLPDGTRHEAFGVESFWIAEKATLNQTFAVEKTAAPGRVRVEGILHYLACTDTSCDPPRDVPFTAELEIAGGGPPVGLPEVVPESTGGADEESLFIFLLLAVGAGLFALAMPCTYPMIPITISFFTKQADERGGKVLPLALTYGAGIVVIFVLIGVFLGGAIIPFATNPVVNLTIGVVFLVFGLALFGLITLQPPQFLMRSATKASNRGGFVGVFLMGMTLVVTSFTCTAPFVGSLIATGARAGDTGTVALGMTVFGLTMAIPFVFLSLVPGKLQTMPRSGEWMNTLKVFLGFVEIAAALKFFSNAELVWNLRILPRELFLTLWAAIFLCAALFLFGIIRVKGESGTIGPGRMVVAVGTLLAAAYFAHGSLGYRLDNMVMLAFEPPYSSVRIGGPARPEDKKNPGRTIIKDDCDRAVVKAREEQKRLLVNFTGHT